jgi:mannose-1-phosphate guanylyltransferase
MKAIILLGGIGSRLRPFTLETPKPLLPVLNRPFFSYQLDQLKKHGVREIVLALGYRAAHFRRHLGDGRRWSVRFHYSLEKTPLGTGGAMRNALGFLSGPTFVLNGDILSDLDLGRLRSFHVQRKAQATLALVPVEDPSQYGLIETDRNGRIRRFIEKPTATEATSNTINAGYYLFEPEIFREIPEGQAVSVEREVFPRLVKSGFSLHGFLHKGYWIDVGTLKSYWKVHGDLLVKSSDTKKSGLDSQGRKHNETRTVITGKKCKVGKSVIFEGWVSIGDKVVIENGAHLVNSIVHEGTLIGSHARVENSLVGAGCRIGAYCHVGPYAAVAPGSILREYTQTASGSWEE